MDPSFYDILGVSKAADLKEIQLAYRRLAHQYHPDKNHAPQAESEMKTLNAIYAVLSDQEQRRRYDAAHQAPARRSPKTVFADERRTLDSRARPLYLRPGDSVFCALEISAVFLGIVFRRQDYVEAVVQRVFHTDERQFYAAMFGWPAYKEAVCSVYIADQEIVVFEDDFEQEWLGQISYRSWVFRRSFIPIGFGVALVTGFYALCAHLWT